MSSCTVNVNASLVGAYVVIVPCSGQLRLPEVTGSNFCDLRKVVISYNAVGLYPNFPSSLLWNAETRSAMLLIP